MWSLNRGKERQLQYAFSTKIADSISSGKCFVLYAPKELACSKYILENGCGWLATTKDKLNQVLVGILSDAKQRDEVLQRAHDVAIRNHCQERNARRFQEIIQTVKI